MKIGIITFWQSQDNYGQILQCYALQQYLRNHGHSPYLIRYIPQKEKTGLGNKILKICNPSYLFAYMQYRRNAQRQRDFNQRHPRRFDDFKNKYLKSTSRIFHSYEELWRESWTDTDVFICGSDQIWSPNQDKQAYFLRFAPVDIPKIAYAASFGRKELLDDYRVALPELLASFTAVSVREAEGLKFCHEAGYTDAVQVCDPTMLLDGSDYLTLTTPQKDAEKYTFCYLINWETFVPVDEINSLLKERNVKFFPANGCEKKNYFDVASDLRIESWLSGISNAEYVVTNSFHGTVFSILMKRPFVVLPLIGNDAQMNGRIISLLKMLNLSERIYDSAVTLRAQMARPIDWDDVYQRLMAVKSKSESFLEKSLCVSRDYVKPSHICFKTNGEVNHNYGGLDRVTEVLADFFVSQGIKVSFLSFKKRELNHDARQHFFPKAEEFDCRENSEFLAAFIEDNGVDVLINQEANVNIHVSLPVEIEKKIVKLSVLHFAPNYIHDSHFDYKFSQSKSLISRFMSHVFRIGPIKQWGLRYLREKLAINYRRQIAYCDAFVMLSNNFRDELASLIGNHILPADRVGAINNPNLFKSTSRALYIKENTLLYVGRMEDSQKRIGLLLDIWKEIAPELPEWKFVIVGDGPARGVLEKKIKIDSIDRVQLVGISDPVPYYQSSAILLFASRRTEGWGLVLTEAQSKGCIPVVFDTYASLADIIIDGETGIMVKDNDFRAYCEAVVSLAKDNQRRSRMAEGCIDSVAQFDVEKIASRWIYLIYAIKRKKEILR